MIATCDKCGNKFPAHGPPQVFELGGPFVTNYRVNHGRCDSCGAEFTMMVTDAKPEKVISWERSSEVMLPGRDYIWANDKVALPDGQRPLYIAWAWMPTADDEAMAEKMIKAIKSDEDLRRAKAYTLLLLEADRPVASVVRTISRFTACALIRPHVMAGCWGPHPGFRVEQSILRTWTPCGLKAVKHYWPAISLADQDYVPLAEEQKLQAAWAEYYRRNLPLMHKERRHGHR